MNKIGVLYGGSLEGTILDNITSTSEGTELYLRDSEGVFLRDSNGENLQVLPE